MHILVTGGCGFIGTHLVKALLARGDDVTVLDDLSSGKRENAPASVRFIQGDVTDEAAVASAMEKADACFHLAAIASVPVCQEQWYRAHCVNQSGLVNVLNQSRKKGAPIPVVYASSAAVYGDVSHTPVAEPDAGTPLSPYGLDKYLCERQAAMAGAVYRVPTIGLRFFNVYGPGQDPHSPYSGVISAFIHKAGALQPLLIHGDGHQERDFIYIADVVGASLAALGAANDKAPVVNICTGTGTTILDLATTINGICHNDQPIQFGPARANDIRRSIGDPSLATRELPFRASTTMEDGLSQTVREISGLASGAL